MKLTVNGRYVDLDFETRIPITLSQQFASEGVARVLARKIAEILKLKEAEGLWLSEQARRVSQRVKSKRKGKKCHGP